MTENQILKGCKSGDKLAYRALVDQYSATLMGICVRYMKDESIAKDALQEAYIRIFKSIRNIEESGNFVGWMRKIAVNECLKLINKQGKIIDIDTKLETIQTSLEPTIISRLNEEDILKEINKLPEHYRIVFNLYEIEGYSHKEIGKILGIKEASSRTKLTRAKQLIVGFFDQLGDEKKTDSLKSYLA